MVERFFNPQEVNRQLPVIKKMVDDILSKAQQARLLMAAPANSKREGQLIELDRSIKSLMNQLEEMGCYYKDWSFELGLVDFPAIIQGQESLLCWRSDEPQVAWFHGFDDGYAGRHPITKDLIFS